MQPRRSLQASLQIALYVSLGAALLGCSRSDEAGSSAARPDAAAGNNMRVTRSAFGTLADGTAVELFTLTNAGGMQVQVTNYGGIITSIKVPDRSGRLGDVALGYTSLDGYLKNSPYFGAIIGRYANRIGGAQFTLDGQTYKLPANDGPNTLHGGIRGFDKVAWQAEPFEKPGEAGIVFTHTSPDGDQGFPGTLSVRVTYTLTDRNELAFDYYATTDQPTVINLTQHTYFNLAGEGSGDVLAHEVMINADRYTPVNAVLIPTGELASVAGTPFDFRSSTPIGARIDADHPQIERGHGYDHNFVLNDAAPADAGSGSNATGGAGAADAAVTGVAGPVGAGHGESGGETAGEAGSEGRLVLAARVEEPTSGRVLEVRTSEPGVQFYTGNFLDGSITGKSGRPYRRRGGFCLETQHFPDSPNQPSFPTTTLRPGEEYRSRTVYAFSVLPE